VGYRQLPFSGVTIEYVVDGPEDAQDLLLFHPGTPCAAVPFEGLTRAAAAAGMRTAIYSRPGYARSTRRPGRTVADEAPISAALADRLGHERFFTAGWSGGGPVALACAALLPERVRVCLTLGSLAPLQETRTISRGWYGPDDLREWEILASEEATSLLPDYEAAVDTFGRRTARHFAGDSRASESDRAAARADGLGRWVARSMRRAVSRGYHGFYDDNVAEARDWGFRVADIRVPVIVRHGEDDRYVTVDHGRWLAQTIPGARGVFQPDLGHFAVLLPFEEVVAQLVEAAAP
jgi:pimeloyl-ACP methyl ester carboxylesterase